ncbi:MAG: tRNA (adenosine(37)-N6)-threonylcarbamoyltransferase complex dimerization subunit type 1 TsaB [Akkermansiaceae bacterium]|nr:tRNA (adenosine(37)-N6)-threonylcarbamoyltransferase complex dimerization subunit type 1 TsaB [Akkermansiaceae bacterium]
MAGAWQLGIESSTGRASVALARGEEVLREAAVETGRKPSAALMEPLREVLAALPGGERLEAVVIGTGPASYNGARVGIAAGQGVALAAGCPAVGVCSFLGVEAVRGGDRCLAVGDARRETYFILPLAAGRLSGGVSLMPHTDFIRSLEAGDGRLISFEGGERLHLPPEVAARLEVVEPEARLLLEAWRGMSGEDREEAREIPPEPFYLREPYVTTAKDNPARRGRDGA